MKRICSLLLAAALCACAGQQPAARTADDGASRVAAPAQPVASDAAASAPLVAIPNAAQPEPGLLTGGPPSAQDLQDAAAAGYATVITLRTEGEAGSEDEREQVEALGMRFVSIPIAGADDLSEANARDLGAVLEAAASKPAMLHCGSGNRAGALLALEAFYVRKQSAEAALELGKRAGLTTLEPAVRERLGAAAAQPATK